MEETALRGKIGLRQIRHSKDLSRVKTPKDNSEIERFNQTLEHEWLYNFNLSLDSEELGVPG